MPGNCPINVAQLASQQLDSLDSESLGDFRYRACYFGGTKDDTETLGAIDGCLPIAFELHSRPTPGCHGSWKADGIHPLENGLHDLLL